MLSDVLSNTAVSCCRLLLRCSRWITSRRCRWRGLSVLNLPKRGFLATCACGSVTFAWEIPLDSPIANISILVFTKSVDSNFRVFWLAPVTRNILVIHCLGTGFKMASRFSIVCKNKILAVNEAAAPANTKKDTKSGLSVFTGRY